MMYQQELDTMEQLGASLWGGPTSELLSSTFNEDDHQIFGDFVGIAPVEDNEDDDDINVPEEEDKILLNENNDEETQGGGGQDLLGQIICDMEIDDDDDDADKFFIEGSKADSLFLPTAAEIQQHFAASSRSAPSPAGTDFSSSGDSTQSLIDEMEEFLSQQGQGQDQEEEQEVKQEEVDDDDLRDAEQLLDDLMKGNIMAEEDEVKVRVSDSSFSDSGFLDVSNLSNVSEVVTCEGQRVIIVIQNDVDNDNDSIGVNSPAVDSIVDSDEDWSPDSPIAKTKGRGKAKKAAKAVKAGSVQKKKARGPYKKRSEASYHAVEDKKERKKLQNVVAARRYRDKKKSEMGVIGEEEEVLTTKNEQLKSTLGEIEAEVKTLRKLMLELGIVTKV